jgi:hypothetical protein
VILNLPESAAHGCDVAGSYLPVVFAGFFTGSVLVVPALTRWFGDRNR